MGGGVDRTALTQRDLGVDLGGGDVGVAEHLLMKRMSAPPSSISVATVCLNRWQALGLPTPE